MDSNSADKIRSKLNDKLKEIKDDEEKFRFLVNRIVNAETENERLKTELADKKKKVERIPLLEKKLASVEKILAKTELAKSKLEELCRELRNRIKKMEQTHSESVASLKANLQDIQKTVVAREEQKKEVERVDSLSIQLKELSTQYEKRLDDLKQLYQDRESGMNNINKSKDEEIGLLKTELETMRIRVTEVFQENVDLKKSVSITCDLKSRNFSMLESEEKLKSTLESEIGMRKLLNSYSEKYENLMGSLVHSNESFERVKKEMSKMNNNLIRVEAESRRWKSRLDEANALIIGLTSTKVECEKTLALKDRQLAQLQELCRKLQKESRSSDSVLFTTDEAPTQLETSEKTINESVQETTTVVALPAENLIAQEN